MKNPTISLILPCYNEAEHIEKSIIGIIDVFDEVNHSYEIILIDDKSTDNTPALLRKIRKKFHKFPLKLIFNEKNIGRGAVVSEGIKLARGKYVGYMDIDCEISPVYLPEFIKALERGADVVTAVRKYQICLRTFHRWLTSKIYALMIKRIFRLQIHDTEAGYKFFNRKKIIPVVKITKDKHWFWDTEILVKARINNLRITEIPAVFKRRLDKTSTVKLIPDTLKYIISINNLRREIYNGSI